MNESAPPQGSDLSVPVDLTDLDPPSGAELSAPSAKKARLKYSQPSSSGSSATGRPPGTSWAFFTRSAVKQNKSHYSALCNGCTLVRLNVKVLGVSNSMKSHLQKCDNVSEAVHSWAKDWTKDSEPFVSDAADSGIVTPSGPSQSGLQRFMPLKDMAMSATQQEEFHMLLLKETVSGNLPFSWINNEYIQAAFAIARPTADLPSRRALSGSDSALLHFAFFFSQRSSMQVWLVCQLKQLVALQKSYSRRLLSS